ncbi:MAG: hypothetical protein FWG92_04245 [Leptospirales bacterium]|nr:hypothetical protein [Leptospirales bacterium]
MLIINGFFENGVFVPEKPIADIKGKQKAVLQILNEDERQERLTAWKEFSTIIRESDEVLEGEPERIQFRDSEAATFL